MFVYIFHKNNFTDQMYLIHEEGLLLRFCQQITSGMARLHQIDAIPKDLAARCCQVTHDHNIKVKKSNTLGFFLPTKFY